MGPEQCGQRGERGYTLVEILGAFFIMTIILTLVSGIFVENGRQRAASLGLMNEALSAAAALEQVSADLEGALFLKATSGRPDENPWRFSSEGSGELGARSLRFMTQNAPAGNRPVHASQWVEVSYFVEEDREGNLDLWRGVAPRPPTEVQDRYPRAGDEGTMRVATDVVDLGFRFRDELGEWLDDWDSAFASPESPLPSVVEFNLQLYREARIGETEDGSDRVPARPHSRRVVLPMKTIDVAKLIELEEDAEDDEECFTVAQCLAEGDRDWYEDQLDDDCGGDEDLCEMLSNSSETCWSEIVAASESVAAEAPETCETS